MSIRVVTTYYNSCWKDHAISINFLVRVFMHHTVYSGIFCVIFLTFCISHQGRHSRKKSKNFLNETPNLNEMWKVYSERFIFCGVYHKNTRKIPTKCGIQQVYSQQCKNCFLLTCYVTLFFVNGFYNSNTTMWLLLTVFILVLKHGSIAQDTLTHTTINSGPLTIHTTFTRPAFAHKK